jgi:MoaA/NifB/PqqE/SkfB family radical SAM enzyme
MSAIPADRGLRNVKARALQAAQPLTVHLELTYKCNWRCVFCYNPRHSDLKPLEVAEWLGVLDGLRELGTLWVSLTGGEPLAHPRFFDIARGARERSLAVRIFTNGALIDDSTADEIQALRPTAVEMSLHGSTPEVHDRATAQPGSFTAMFAGLERLRKRGVALVLKTPLTHINEHQTEDIIALAEGLSIPLRVDPTITPNDNGDRSPLAYAASQAAIQRMFERVRELGQIPFAEREEGGLNCGLGRMTMAIDPEGNVYPCLQWRQSSLGNVRTTPLVRLWRESSVRAETAEISRTANDAMIALGGSVSKFPFCPALAMAHTGNPLVPSAEHIELAEAADRARGLAH